MKKIAAFVAGALGAAMLAQPVLAQSTGHTEYARVTNVTPVYRTVEVSTPRRECEERPVTHHRPARRHHAGHGHGGHGQSVIPLILGGLVGGVVGNQFGKGTGNVIATAAGALVGGQVGRNLDERTSGYGYHGYQGGGSSYTTTETHCTTVNSYHTEERADGYRVEYRYNGRTYTTRMDRHPGDRIPVNVSVTPTY